MLFGVVLPALITSFGAMSAPKRISLLVLNHPVETISEILLIASIPLINYLLWNSLCKNDRRFSLLNGLALGAAAMSSALVAVFCLSGLVAGSQQLQSDIGTPFTEGFSWLMIMAGLTCAASVYIMNRFRATRDFSASKNQIAIYTACGALVSLAGFGLAETRSWDIRLAEKMACSNDAKQEKEGLVRLRALNPQRELLMECSDSRAAGLAGLFIPLKASSQHELYFAVTGKPFSFNDSNNSELSAMPDDYVSRHSVGDKIPGLSLIRSSLTSEIHPWTLSATSNWTFVFKNDTSSPQEARAEIGLPPGAVITSLTRWINGEPRNSTFAASGKVSGTTNNIEVNHESAAIATDLGRGRVLIHCYPVSAEEQLKIRVTIVEPLKPDSEKTATMVLPKLLATNFEGLADHAVRLTSTLNLSTGLKELKGEATSPTEYVISGALKDKQLENTDVIITASRPDRPKAIAVYDKIAVEFAQRIANQQAIEKAREARKLEEENKNSEQVVVMLNGSKGVGSQLDDVAKALKVRNQKSRVKILVKEVPPQYVCESVSRTSAPAPKHLVVVVDGSSGMKKTLEQVKQGLAKLPTNVPASLMIASQEQPELMKAVPLAKGLKEMEKAAFVGGQDNLEAVVAAAEEAGKSEGGVVLWIHGPQPVLNSNVYIMAPYKWTPTFYEMPIDTGETDMFEFFKNHSEVGPFAQVPRSSNVPKDLELFFSKWNAESNDYSRGI